MENEGNAEVRQTDEMLSLIVDCPQKEPQDEQR